MTTGERLNRVFGPVADLALIGVAAAVAELVVQRWLLDRRIVLYWGTSLLHLVVMPVTFVVLLMPWSGVNDLVVGNERSARSSLFVWSTVLFLCAGFIVPGVLSLAIDIHLGVMLATIFGPYGLMAVALWILIRFDDKTQHRFSKVGAKPPVGVVPVVALLIWAYLLLLETTLLVVVGSESVLSSPPVMMLAVLVGYVPTRIFLYFLRPHGRIEVATMVLSIAHLVVRLSLNR